MSDIASFNMPGGQMPNFDPHAEPCSLLIVDDNEANRDVLSRRLQRRGYRVTTANDGAAALGLLLHDRFDLVLLDVMMPGLNGLDVLRIIRQNYTPTQLPVIMATAKSESEDIVAALELGASDYVTKPFDFAIVLARVRVQLALKRSVEQVLALEGRLSHRNAELELQNERMKRDISAAAKIQTAFLPTHVAAVPGMRFAWAFHPCESLAGDFLNICRLDENHVGIYVLDVSGHGVAAALLSVTLSRALSAATGSLLLRRESIGTDRIVPPAEVAARLGQRFPWDEATEQFFTIVYGVIDLRTCQFRYVSAGHPGVAVVRRDSAPEIIRTTGFPIGLGEASEENMLQLQPGDRLYLYSDGVIEAMSSEGEQFGDERLLAALSGARTVDFDQSTSGLIDELRIWCGRAAFQDDISVLGVEIV